MTTVRVRATGSGRIVGWSEFKRGEIVDASRLGRFFFTTTLTDVITDLCAVAVSLNPDYKIRVVVPNGFTTAALDVVLTADEFEVYCERRLTRGWFPLNPLAAEFGSNYDVTVTINCASDEVKSAFLDSLQSKYTCTSAPTAK
jgi:hypothetical protein